jgi:hypothetical protein
VNQPGAAELGLPGTRADMPRRPCVARVERDHADRRCVEIDGEQARAPMGTSAPHTRTRHTLELVTRLRATLLEGRGLILGGQHTALGAKLLPYEAAATASRPGTARRPTPPESSRSSPHPAELSP